MKKNNFMCTSLLLSGLLLMTATNILKADQNGLFVGSSLGFTTLTKVYPDRSNSMITPYMMSFGANVGYSYYFTSYFGIRGYADGFYNFSYSVGKQNDVNGVTSSTTSTTNSNIVSTSGNYIQAGLNADLVYDLFRGLGTAFGIYAGVGGAWGMYRGSGGLVIPINAGFSALFRDNQRFDIGLKIPVTGVEIDGASHQNTIVNVRYYYIFNF